VTRSPQLNRFLRAWRLAQQCHARGLSAREAIDRDEARRDGVSRRTFLGAMGTAGATAAIAPFGAPARMLAAAPRVAIVGAGLAGLACADRLQARGVSAVVYEAGTRLGGRCFSNRTLVAGMACENGGELIDTGHKTMLGYANQFGLPLESYVKKRGEERFWFLGRAWSDEDVVD
jgi:monoamine oxidase